MTWFSYRCCSGKMLHKAPKENDNAEKWYLLLSGVCPACAKKKIMVKHKWKHETPLKCRPHRSTVRVLAFWGRIIVWLHCDSWRIKQRCTDTYAAVRRIRTKQAEFILPSSGEPGDFKASLSLSRLELRCFSSSRCFSALASSQWPSSIRRWSGRRRLSVGATSSSGSLSVKASVEK